MMRSGKVELNWSDIDKVIRKHYLTHNDFQIANMVGCKEKSVRYRRLRRLHLKHPTTVKPAKYHINVDHGDNLPRANINYGDLIQPAKEKAYAWYMTHPTSCCSFEEWKTTEEYDNLLIKYLTDAHIPAFRCHFVPAKVAVRGKGKVSS
jgi:hypothetical protein